MVGWAADWTGGGGGEVRCGSGCGDFFLESGVYCVISGGGKERWRNGDDWVGEEGDCTVVLHGVHCAHCVHIYLCVRKGAVLCFFFRDSGEIRGEGSGVLVRVCRGL